MSLEDMQDIKKAPPIVQQAHELHRREMADRDEVRKASLSVLTIHDLTKQNYWFVHKGKHYSMPYPTVECYYYYATLTEKFEKKEKNIWDKFSNDFIAFWLLYYSDERIFQEMELPARKVMKDVGKIKNFLIKTRHYKDMIENINEMMGLERLAKPSEYAELFSSQDMIIGIAQTFGMSFKEVLNLKIPAFACILNYNDKIAYTQEKLYEDNDKP